MKKIILAVFAFFAFGVPEISASGDQGFFKSLEYEVNAGTNIGGASPIPLPAEIRKINSYSPELNLQIGATVRKWFGAGDKWGAGLE